MTGGVVQVVEHLPHKRKALSSKPSIKKKKKHSLPLNRKKIIQLTSETQHI
jgi:hypothetical protein